MNSTNIAATRPDHDDARLRTRRFRLPLAHVAAAAKVIAPALKTYGRRWRVTALNAESQAVTVRVEVPVLLFTDDLIITVRAAGDPQISGGETIVDVRSASRVGRADFGENRRHISQFLRTLDAQLEPPRS